MVRAIFASVVIAIVDNDDGGVQVGAALRPIHPYICVDGTPGFLCKPSVGIL